MVIPTMSEGNSSILHHKRATPKPHWEHVHDLVLFQSAQSGSLGNYGPLVLNLILSSQTRSLELLDDDDHEISCWQPPRHS